MDEQQKIISKEDNDEDEEEIPLRRQAVSLAEIDPPPPPALNCVEGGRPFSIAERRSAIAHGSFGSSSSGLNPAPPPTAPPGFRKAAAAYAKSKAATGEAVEEDDEEKQQKREEDIDGAWPPTAGQIVLAEFKGQRWPVVLSKDATDAVRHNIYKMQSEPSLPRHCAGRL